MQLQHLFRKLAILALFLFAASMRVCAANNPPIDKLSGIFMQKNHVPGLSIAIIKGNTLTTYNYGYANELTKTKTSNNTIYSVASFTKTFTGTLVAIAQVENKLNLDKPFSSYIPALKNNTNLDNMTVKMLITHSGGLPFNLNPAPNNFNQAVKQLKNFTPVYTPGTKYSYSNLSIGLNGYILENIYQQSYESLLYTKISQRLGLTSTYLELPNKLVPLVALGHENNQLRPYQNNTDTWYAAASLKANIVDMGKYLQAHINYTQLNHKTLTQAIELIHQNYYCFENVPACEQLSWQAHANSQLTSSIEDSNFIGIDNHGNYNFAAIPVTTTNTLKNQAIFIDKSCGGYGMSGYMAYDPVKKVGVVILLNKSLGQERIRLGRDILMELASTPYKD